MVKDLAPYGALPLNYTSEFIPQSVLFCVMVNAFQLTSPQITNAWMACSDKFDAG